MNNLYTRTELLIGSEGVEKLKNASVLVVGVGGVGGYATELLARAGVGKITIVDSDKVDITNLNRQIIALNSTIGKLKVDVLKDRLLDINPSLNVVTHAVFYDDTTYQDIFSEHFDYVLDAIDSVPSKLHLICYAKEKGINIISAMGAGNRYELGDFKVMDIYKTSGDRLARKMRKLLKDRGIKSLDVVCTDIPTMSKYSSVVGSISYMPPLCGVKMAGYVINQLLKKD